MKVATAYLLGRARALEKLGLEPPTQVDQFVADVEGAQDVPPTPEPPPMGDQTPPALDGTTPLQLPSSSSPPTPMDTMGSTVGPPPMAGDPGQAPPMMGG